MVRNVYFIFIFILDIKRKQFGNKKISTKFQRETLKLLLSMKFSEKKSTLTTQIFIKCYTKFYIFYNFRFYGITPDRLNEIMVNILD